jgi:putative ABC transport system permease protein
MSDVRLALRSLLKQPRFSIVAVLTIAVGIGATSALFSVYDRLVLNPVTIPNPSALVAVLNSNPQLSAPSPSVSWPRFTFLRDRAQSFAAMATSTFDNFTLTGGGEPEQLNGLRASGPFFDALGIVPARGRVLSADDDVPNGPAVCLISYELWQGRFGGREDLVGQAITLNGQPWQVVGITPPRLTVPFRQVQVFAPRVFELGGLTAAQVQAGAGYTQVIARLKPGVSVEASRQELARLSEAYRRELPALLDAQNTSVPRPYIAFIAGGLAPTFNTLLAAVAVVLLIACANVSSLFLARLAARHREIAVRQSLGAMRARVVRQLLVESLCFSTIAGALGLLLAIWALAAIQPLVFGPGSTAAALSLNWRALGVSAGVTLVAALLVGLVPAIQASKTDLVEALKERARGSSERGGRFRSGLIVVEVALSVMLLVGSGLLLASFARLQQTPLGFDPDGLAMAFVGVPATRYPTPAQQSEFFMQVVDRLRADPRVSAASAGVGLPLAGFNPRSPYSVEGRPILPLPQRPLAGLGIVADGYFEAMGIGVAAGRTFTSADRTGSPGVCVINEALARRLFPGESPLGKVLLRGRDAEIRSEIVGVIRDVRTIGATLPVPDEIYFPLRQMPRPAVTVVARTEGDPSALQTVLRAAIASVDPNQPISFFSTMQANIAGSLGSQRVVTWLTGIFAAVALLLAAVGLYSVIAFAVSQRTAEIGIRMALGAQARQVVLMVMRGGLRLVVIGVVLGLLGAAAASRLIRTLLFGVEPLDPTIYAAVAALFILTATLACFMPSLRAARVDPLVALRD